jgi:HK97 gp10 family phage protein
MAVKVTMQGFEELYAKLREIEESAGPIVEKALGESIKPIHTEAQRLAPYDVSGHISKRGEGHLKLNVPINNIEKAGSQYHISIGWEKGDNSPYFYAKFLEWGTTKMGKQPFMQPAYQRMKNKAFQTFAQEVKKGLGL